MNNVESLTLDMIQPEKVFMNGRNFSPYKPISRGWVRSNSNSKREVNNLGFDCLVEGNILFFFLIKFIDIGQQ